MGTVPQGVAHSPAKPEGSSKGLGAAGRPSGVRGAGSGAGCGCLRGGRAERAWLAAQALEPGRAAVLLSRPVFSFKYHHHPPAPATPPEHNITVFCSEWEQEIFASRCNSQIGGALGGEREASFSPGKGCPGRGCPRFWALCFFHASEKNPKNPDSSHSTDAQGPIFTDGLGFFISGRSGGSSCLWG